MIPFYSSIRGCPIYRVHDGKLTIWRVGKTWVGHALGPQPSELSDEDIRRVREKLIDEPGD